eukprot:TRINITY_DN18455_c0_g4_i2.p1 TRINITY_DN18455_c0_g4~~TRINITY_DN18455_c0_g4_i2.p1  ORF type:complete len:483 (+),score=73.28 TRINITY_DN18455_c0_g4_i2:126-1574(+)
MEVVSPTPGFAKWGSLPPSSVGAKDVSHPIKSMKLDSLKVLENPSLAAVLRDNEESVVHYSLVVTEEACGGMDVNRVFVITNAAIYKFPRTALQTGIAFDAMYPLISLTQLIVIEGSQRNNRVQFRGLKPATGERHLFTIRFEDQTKMKECILLICHLLPTLPVMKKKTIEGRHFDMSYIDTELTKTRTPPTTTSHTSINKISLPKTLHEELLKKREIEGDNSCFLIDVHGQSAPPKGDTRLNKGTSESPRNENQSTANPPKAPSHPPNNETTKKKAKHIGPYASGTSSHTKLMSILDKYVKNALDEGPPDESQSQLIIPPNTLPHHGYNPPPSSQTYRRYLDGTARLIGQDIRDVQAVGDFGMHQGGPKRKQNEKKSVGLPADNSAERKQVTEMLTVRNNMQESRIKEVAEEERAKSLAVQKRQQGTNTDRKKHLQEMLSNMKYEHGLHEYVLQQQHKNKAECLKRVVNERRTELVSKEHT